MTTKRNNVIKFQRLQTEREEEDAEFKSAACELLSKQTSLKHSSACFCPQTASEGGKVIAAAEEEEALNLIWF